MASFQCLLAKYDQVDSPPSGILDEYTDDDYYLSKKKSNKKSNKGGKTSSPPSSDRGSAKTFSMSSLKDTKSNDEGNFSNIRKRFLIVN